MKIRKTKTILFIIFITIVSFAVLEMKKIYWGGLDKSIYFNTLSFLTIAIFMGIVGVSILMIIFNEKKRTASNKRSFFCYVSFALIGIFPSYFLQFSPWGFVITSIYLRILLLLSSSFLMTYLFYRGNISKYKISNFFPSLIILASSLLLSNRLRLIVNYPFSLSWSEGNRFWDYSLFLRKNHYHSAPGSNIAAFLDIGRQSLWGIAFVFRDLSISGLRAWNAILYFLPPFIFGVLIFKNKRIHFPILLLLGLWTYVFLSQGPIYAPLLICAILILISVEVPIFPISLLLVTIAGFYVNLTRFTWIIAPPVWAFLLFYFKEKHSSLKTRNLKGFSAAFFGLIGALVLPNFIKFDTSSIILEENTSPEILESITKIFSNQDLLWNRLLPSKTFPLGILPALFILVIPLFVILMNYFRKTQQSPTNVEKFYILSSSIGFLLIGSVVSVKVGGGSNLHNMDMFLLTVLIVFRLFWNDGLADWFNSVISTSSVPVYMILFLLLYLNIQPILTVSPVKLPSAEVIDSSLSSIQNEINNRKAEGEILFIDQRQLVTFNEITGVEMVGEYEKKLMMNEALSGNTAYFNKFYTDLKNKRFSLIISEPLNITYQEDETSYGEENDAYVKWVSEPLFCYYEALETFSQVGVELLIPRVTPIPAYLNCP